MSRRNFIAGLASTTAALPLAVRAQQLDRIRRVGVLIFLAEDDPEGKRRIATLTDGLQQLGWTIGRDVLIDIRWGAADAARARRYAAELVALAPDVIVTTLREVSRTVPNVFVAVTDPVGAGYIASLARPGGNATGFTFLEYGMGGKWLELLKEIVPGITRVAILRDPALPVGIGLLGAIQSAAPSLRLETSPIDVRDPDEIERAVTDFSRFGNGGLIVTAGPGALINRNLIIALAAQHKLPAIYFQSGFVKAGGLISYGPDAIAQYRQAAVYIDRILRGEKPADLPVQAPTKYETAINLKTAKTLGLTIPPTLLARADEVIE